MNYKFFYIFIFILLSHKSHSQKQVTQQNLIAIKNVNVIQMTSPNKILYNATVIIKGTRIESINGSILNAAEIIDGKGKWLIPGLIDMHVHIQTDFSVGKKLPTQAPDIIFDTQDLMTPFIANGATTVFTLNANVESFSQRKKIEKGSVIGPRMTLAALINGGDGSGRIANTPEDGRQAVRDAKAEGYEFIKLYSQLNRETYVAIVDEAYKQGLKTVGHIPNDFQGKLEQAFVPHFDMVAHAEEFSKHARDFRDQEARRFAMLAKENGTWLSPTLITMVWIANQAYSLDSLKALPSLQYVHPLLQSKWLTTNNYNRNTTPERAAYLDKLVKFHFQLVRVFKEVGVPMVAGTDAGTSAVVGGFSLHDELELLQEAGLTPEEALTSATRLSAVWLGLDSEIGTSFCWMQTLLITGRIYTITIHSKNAAGFEAVQNVKVYVPLTIPEARAKRFLEEAEQEDQEIAPSEFTVTPNPSNHYFTLRSYSTDDKKTEVSVSDVSGRVLQKFIAGKNNSVNFGDNLSAGMYFVTIQKGNKQKVIKIVKQ